MATGYFTFKWDDPSGDVQEVYVTGTFDGWGKSVQLFREEGGGSFVSRVELPVEKTQYKFVVDGEWVIDTEARKEFEDGIENNILIDEDFEGHEKPAEKVEEKVEDAEEKVVDGGEKSEGEDSDDPETSSDGGDADEEDGDTKAVNAGAVEVDAAESESSFDSEVADPNAVDAEAVHVDAVDSTSEGGVAFTETTDDTGEIITGPPGAADESTEDTKGSGEYVDAHQIAEKAPEGVADVPKASFEVFEAVAGVSAATDVTSEAVDPNPLEPTVVETPGINESADTEVQNGTVSSVSPLSTTATLAAAVPKETPPSYADTIKDATISSASPDSSSTALAADVSRDVQAKGTPADETPKAAQIPKEIPAVYLYNTDGTPKVVPTSKETPAESQVNADGTPKKSPEEPPVKNGTPLEFFKRKPTVIMGVATIVGFFLTRKYLFSKRS